MMAGTGTSVRSTSSPEVRPKPKRRPRGSLDLEEVITGAFELADEVSIAGLSMPVLAKHLDVPVTSIYWHFRKKEQLLDAMTERATRQYHFTNPFSDGGSWQDALRNHFRKMKLVFAENPVLCELILMRTGELSQEATQTSVDNLEAVIAVMVDAGFKPGDALTVYLALSAHSRGTAMIEHQNNTGRYADARRPTGVTAAHPHLYELEYQGHSILDLEFEFTLEAIITRAETLLAKPSRKRPANRK
ncbi:MAG: TetR family transcriptional regulator [Mycolicibacterium sp.]|jgi:AcrR family transcriptional regulator|uniref:TetR family transcriptional regulator n=2 Tax=Mycolicibacterium insubricum TaxID=444597 RepID=A0A1X0D111_9MYCO|nr:TetR family transcriptional regulator [Mycolicibacterium sp.]MCV7080331.1 TetR family transcriptional regulator [Mycolicibacterium insubricum]ORA66114.1 TetR family transcriptional regulator [Mycolicibacterium insubricum]